MVYWLMINDHSPSNGGDRGEALFNPSSIEKTYGAVCLLRLRFIMCYHHYRAVIFFVQFVKNFHYFDTHLTVKVSGRLICKYYFGITYYGAGDSYTLALTSG